MDTPENYYATLGVTMDADTDTLKRAYRQLARRFHPDLAGPDGATQMKRINRAYAVLSDPEKRQSYDTVIGGIIDLRGGAVRARMRPRPHDFDPHEDIEFSGLNIFSSKGPLRAGPSLQSSLGVITALNSVQTVGGLTIAAGSLDSTGKIWKLNADGVAEPIQFAADPSFTIESLRELRFSEAGTLLAGWGRLHLHVWDAYHGTRLWSYGLTERAVSAHYSLDATLHAQANGQRTIRMALPLLLEDSRGPRALGVRGSDIVTHVLSSPQETANNVNEPLACIEESIEKRQFWAIRLRALSQDQQTLVTLSCAHVRDETHEMVIVRTWNLSSRTRLGGRLRPQINTSILLGRCADCTPPYAITPDTRVLAFVSKGNKILVCDTQAGTYTEFGSGTMGSSSRLAISPDGEWLAIAREDSEVNEGVIDLWSIATGQIMQKLYHPWQISTLHFAHKQLIVALTDGTIQVWE
ncbi:MAG TPA: DnaJ domain-containing protein [Ktedonobacteraceae bacterium]